METKEHSRNLWNSPELWRIIENCKEHSRRIHGTFQDIFLELSYAYIYIGQNFDFSELVGDRDWSCTERTKFKKKDTCNFILQNLKTCFLNALFATDVEHDAQNFMSFWTIFWPFTLSSPLKTPKIKILKNWEKSLEMLSFYTCEP